MRDQTLGLRIDAGALRERIGVKYVGTLAEHRLHVVLEQAMDQDHVTADQFLLA